MRVNNLYAAEFAPADVAHITPLKVAVFGTHARRDAWVRQARATRTPISSQHHAVAITRRMATTAPGSVFDLAALEAEDEQARVERAIERNEARAQRRLALHVPSTSETASGRIPRRYYAVQFDVADLDNAKDPQYLAVFDIPDEVRAWCDDWRNFEALLGFKTPGFAEYVESVRRAPLRVPILANTPFMRAVLMRKTLYAKPMGNVYDLEELFPLNQRDSWAGVRDERESERTERAAQYRYLEAVGMNPTPWTKRWAGLSESIERARKGHYEIPGVPETQGFADKPEQREEETESAPLT